MFENADLCEGTSLLRAQVVKTDEWMSFCQENK